MSSFRCPACGAKLEIHKADMPDRGATYGDTISWHGRADVAPVSVPVGGEPWVSRITQARNNLTSVDFAKSTLVDIGIYTACGTAVGVAVAALGFAPWEIAPVSAGLAFVASGVLLARDKRVLLHKTLDAPAGKRHEVADRVLHCVEGDGPKAPARRLHVSASIDDARLAIWARGVLDGQGLGYREWTGKGRLFKGTEYATIRAELQKMGYARDVGGSAGLVLVEGHRSHALLLALAGE